MVFSSITFLFYFLPIVLIMYFLAPVSFRNLVLLAVSLVFYAWGEPVYIFLMVFSICFNYCAGRFIDRRKNEGVKGAGRLAVPMITAVNIGLLGFFKYVDFFIENLNSMAGLSIPPLELPLPIGISFYTFQAMSYILDLNRGKVSVQKSIINFGTYVSLFPQLIAGPIVRIESIEAQLLSRKETLSDFAGGIRQFVCGLGKKVLLANNIGVLWDQIQSMSIGELSAGTAWLGAFAFSFQIYFDFSGYSDMAIGLGKMFGFHFPVNFNYPYISKSVTEFWRRWHISLSTWFREYVYIPLGGNRKGLALQIRNILIVWLLTGFWHGASWNFVVWGLYFGVFLIMEKAFLGSLLSKLPAVIQHFYAMFVVIISWVIFAFDSMGVGWQYLKVMVGMGGNGIPLIDGQTVYLFYTNLILFAVLALGSTRLPIKTAERVMGILNKNHREIAGGTLEIIWIFLILLLCVAYLISSSYNPFLYFRF